jgi:hypothetical protein
MLVGPDTTTPPRRPQSVRRTTHLDVTPSDNPAARHVAEIAGAGRDVLTGPDGEARVLAVDRLSVRVGGDGTIAEYAVEPALPAVSLLLGSQIGPGFRGRIADALLAGAERPIAVLLADLAGAPSGMRYGITRRSQAAGETRGVGVTSRLDCVAWRPGSVALTARASSGMAPLLTPPLAPDLTTDDPWAWHDLPELALWHGRRRRRVDVWRTRTGIEIDAMFRDTNHETEDRHVIVHEYGISATVAPDGRLVRIEATPHVLPLEECPLASTHVATLVGEQLAEVAKDIHRRLDLELSCTHLNDAVRFLADVARLADLLPAS